MSRVGNVPIVVPNGINITNKDNEIEVKHQNQSRSLRLPKNVEFHFQNNIVQLKFNGSNIDSTKDWGTFRQNLNNIIKGFAEGFSKKIILVGTGYKAEVKGNIVRLYLGHSHPFYYSLPEGIKAAYDKSSNSLTLTANNKEILGNVIRNLMNLRKVEPYKGKGVRLENKAIIRKEIKTKK